MADPPDLFAELRLRLQARAEIERLVREGHEHLAAGRAEEARQSLEQSEEIQRRMDALRGA
jgi:hypothetical protein